MLGSLRATLKKVSCNCENSAALTFERDSDDEATDIGEGSARTGSGSLRQAGSEPDPVSPSTVAHLLCGCPSMSDMPCGKPQSARS